MKLGLIAGYSGKRISIPIDTIKHAETLGYDSVWTSEAYGSDAVTPAVWMLANTTKIKVGTAIMQMPGRTPALAAMTAMTVAQLSNNRFIVGLGASGPQVVEGWHGVPYGKPVTRLKEYIQIMKKIFAREEALHFEGKEYQIPYHGPGASNLGKPLKSIMVCEDKIPIYAATLTPAGVQAAAEVADGFFPIWMDPDQFSVFKDPIEKGLKAAGGGKSLADFDVAPFVTVIIGDDVKQCMQMIRGNMALYIGGMGAKGKNFHADVPIRMGYEKEIGEIQDLYLAGKKNEAAAKIPTKLIEEISLVGPKEKITDDLEKWRESIVTTILISGDDETVRTAAELVLG